ncbi:MAG: DUF3301 domain-containing protein, partial [Gammaproteobacteria bacterium]
MRAGVASILSYAAQGPRNTHLRLGALVADTIALLVLAVALWFWNDSARTREQTVKYCRDACRELDIQ